MSVSGVCGEVERNVPLAPDGWPSLVHAGEYALDVQPFVRYTVTHHVKGGSSHTALTGAGSLFLTTQRIVLVDARASHDSVRALAQQQQQQSSSSSSSSTMCVLTYAIPLHAVRAHALRRPLFGTDRLECTVAVGKSELAASGMHARVHGHDDDIVTASLHVEFERGGEMSIMKRLSGLLRGDQSASVPSPLAAASIEMRMRAAAAAAAAGASAGASVSAVPIVMTPSAAPLASAPPDDGVFVGVPVQHVRAMMVDREIASKYADAK